MIPTTSGIYRITCTSTGRFYIGSATNMRARQSQHLWALRNNQHHTQPLQNAWNKYGEDAFTFEVLELVLPMFLDAREQYWLDTLKPFGRKGFNINRQANVPSNAPETREKLRLANLGKPMSTETRAKIGAANKGHQHTLEARAKISAAGIGNIYNLGRKLSPEHRAKLSAAHKGKPAHNRGKKRSPEAIEKMRRAHLGQKRSAAARANISMGLLRRRLKG